MTAQLSVLERPELARVGLEPTAPEPDEITEDVPVPDPVDLLFDGWVRLMTAPLAAVAPGQADAVRDMISRMTRVDELM